MRRSSSMGERIVCLGVVLALLALLVTPAAAINWGEPDEDGRYPNVGAMVAEIPPGSGEWYQICSGTLIAPYVFLTAGHCTVLQDTFPVETMRVNFAENALDFDDDSTWCEVEAAITHPGFNFPEHANPYDVGVLILKENMKTLDRVPAELPPLGLLDDLTENKQLRRGSEEEDFVVVGYGGTLDWPPPSMTYYNQRQYAESEYQALLPAWLRLSQNQATGDGGTGYGDSGGPTFWIDPETDEEFLVATTSWGDRPCVATGFNYRTDIPETQLFLGLVRGLVEDWLEDGEGEFSWEVEWE